MPFHSIIIPTYNRCSVLSIAIKALCLQDFRSDDYEILIVDNASTDDTQKIVAQAKDRYPHHEIRYFYESVPGLLAGRHRGAFESLGDILIFIDDDTEPNPGWLAAINDAFQDEAVHLVGGKNLPKYEVPPPKWLKYLWQHRSHRSTLGQLSLLDFGDKVVEIDPIFVWGLNFSIRKSTFFEVGGFNPDCIPKHLQRYQGDGEFGLSKKLKFRHYKAVYHPAAWVYHRIPAQRMTVQYLEERHFYQGVCDSYSDLRRRAGTPENAEIHRKEERNPAIAANVNYSRSWPTVRRHILVVGKRVVSSLKKMWCFLFQHEWFLIRKRIQKAYQDGYDFHQGEVKNDTTLFDWVLKKNYWDYRLPD